VLGLSDGSVFRLIWMQRFRGLHASEAFAEAFAADQALAKAALDGSSRALRELLERLIDRAWRLALIGV
jgi:hypothetical protein